MKDIDITYNLKASVYFREQSHSDSINGELLKRNLEREFESLAYIELRKLRKQFLDRMNK